MTYYVEPDYWVAGYAEGDYVPGTVLVAGVCTATSSVKSAGILAAGGSGLTVSTSTVLAGGSFTQTFPGINLNAKSQAVGAGNYITKSGGLVSETANVRMTGRPYWEATQPASGTWVTIVPQAEGFGP